MDWKFIVTIIVAIAGIASSAILAIRLARRKKPVWAYVSKQIIGLGTNVPHELRLFFEEKQVDDVYQTLIIFFNAGNQTIRKEDIRDNITICFPKAQVLQIPTVLTPEKPQNKISIEKIARKNGDLIEIEFDFLDHNDGVLLDVLHTACNESISCKGYILEVGAPRYIGKFIPYKYIFTMRRIRNYAIISLIPIIFSCLMIWIDINDGTFPNIPAYVMFPVLIWGIALLDLMPNTIKRIKFPLWSRRQKE
jgi:hypothetical protein